jgi:PBSX family phage terminase large subunit
MKIEKGRLKALWEKWTPAQEKFVFDFEHPEQLLIGGWGAGKTTAGVRKSIILSITNPGSLGMICRQHYTELVDSTMQSFFNECEKLGIIINFNQTRRLVQLRSIDPNKPSVILFRCLDDPAKYQSIELHYIYIDEASEALTDELKYQFLSKRLRQPKMPSYYFFLTSTPPPKNSFLYHLFVERKNENRIVYKAPSYENKENLPESYLKSLEDMPPDLKRKYLYGEWGADITGKPVFPEFNKQLHVNEKLKVNPDLDVIRSWDFGFHRPVCLWMQIDTNNTLNVLYEYMGTDIYLSDFAEKIISISNKKFPFCKFVDTCDPAGSQTTDKGKTSLEILRDYNIIPLYRRMPVMQRVYIIKKLLTTLRGDRPALQIHPDCQILIEAMMGGYHFPETDSPKVKEEPFKDGYYDHVIDALGYAVSIYYPVELPRLPGQIRKAVALSSEKRYLTGVKKF